MIRNRMQWAIAVLGVMGLLTAGVFAWPPTKEQPKEEKISLDKAPTKAKAALLKLAGSNKITNVEKETHDGKELYEANWKADGKTHEATVTADGDLVTTEEDMAASDVPAAVIAAAKAKFPKGAKIEYEKKVFIMYEAESKEGDKEHEVLISPAGQVHEDKHEQADKD
jgi:hypothetical protein